MLRRWLPIILILFGGWGLLEALSFKAELGDYARSPQTVTLNQGVTAIVGGGRAGIVFLDSRFRKKADILVRCKEQQRQVRLRRGGVSEEVCGIRVELNEILPEGKATATVRWGEDADDGNTDDGNTDDDGNSANDD